MNPSANVSQEVTQQEAALSESGGPFFPSESPPGRPLEKITYSQVSDHALIGGIEQQVTNSLTIEQEPSGQYLEKDSYSVNSFSAGRAALGADSSPGQHEINGMGQATVTIISANEAKQLEAGYASEADVPPVKGETLSVNDPKSEHLKSASQYGSESHLASTGDALASTEFLPGRPTAEVTYSKEVDRALPDGEEQKTVNSLTIEQESSGQYMEKESQSTDEFSSGHAALGAETSPGQHEIAGTGESTSKILSPAEAEQLELSHTADATMPALSSQSHPATEPASIENGAAGAHLSERESAAKSWASDKEQSGSHQADSGSERNVSARQWSSTGSTSAEQANSANHAEVEEKAIQQQAEQAIQML